MASTRSLTSQRGSRYGCHPLVEKPDARRAGELPRGAGPLARSGSRTASLGRVPARIGFRLTRIGDVLSWNSEAMATYQQALPILQAAARDPDNSAPRHNLISVYELRGDLCERQAQPTEARQWFQRALDELRM